jgi:predicted nuclease of restriction endonuclease-like (RecB) superfamily
MRIENLAERQFYELEAHQNQWSVRTLQRQFNSGLYERLLLSRDKSAVQSLAQVGQVIQKPHDLLKEPLVLEFLGLEDKNQYSESELETAIINQLEKFMLELGKGFLFGGRQVRFTPF